jgi:hypothetical protein
MPRTVDDDDIRSPSSFTNQRCGQAFDVDPIEGNVGGLRRHRPCFEHRMQSLHALLLAEAAERVNDYETFSGLV